MEAYVPPEYEKYRLDVRNMKFARAKIRKEVQVADKEEIIVDWSGWVPDRSAKVSEAEDEWLMQKLEIDPVKFKHRIDMGKTAHS